MRYAWRRPATFEKALTLQGAVGVESGGSLDIESGATLKIAGVDITADLAALDGLDVELALIDDLTAEAIELNILDGALCTVAELNRATDVSTRVVTLAGSTAITEALHDGKILLMTGTGAAKTQVLPAASGSGAHFRFVVGAVNTSNHIIEVTTTDVMYGQIISCSTGDSPDLAQPWITAADSDRITLDGTTTGGVAVGDMIELIDIAAAKWLVLGHTTCSGTEATPFSAAVS